MSRPARNTSSSDRRRDALRWRVELVVGRRSARSAARAVGRRRDAGADVLLRHLGPRGGVGDARGAAPACRTPALQADPNAPLLVLLPCVPCAADAPKYHRLPLGATLADALRGRTVIEFPTLTVALPADEAKYARAPAVCMEIESSPGAALVGDPGHYYPAGADPAATGTCEPAVGAAADLVRVSVTGGTCSRKV